MEKQKLVQHLKKEPGIPNGEPPENHIDLPLKKNVVCFFDTAQEHVSAAEKQAHVSGEFWREREREKNNQDGPVVHPSTNGNLSWKKSMVKSASYRL